MSTTRPIVRPLVRAITRAITGDDAVSRNFTTLDSAFQKYFEIPSLTPDRIVVDVYSPTGSNVGLPTGAPVPTANKYETLDFVYAGSINELGKNGANYFDGITANWEFYSGIVLLARYEVTEDWINDLVLINSLATLGAELVTNGDFATDTGWDKFAGTTIAGGKLVLNSTSTFTTLASQNVSFNSDTGFVLEFKVTDYVQGTINIRQGTSGANNIIAVTANGTYTVAFIGVAQPTLVVRSSGGDTQANIEVISVREAPGYGTAVNITSADKNPYLFNGAISPNTWTNQNPPFNVIEVAGT